MLSVSGFHQGGWGSGALGFWDTFQAGLRAVLRCLGETESDRVKSEDTGVQERAVNMLTLLVRNLAFCKEGVRDLLYIRPSSLLCLWH